jgi:Cu/Zn superoxide dismutase
MFCVLTIPRDSLRDLRPEGEMVTYISHPGKLANLAVSADGTTAGKFIAPRLALADLMNRSIIVRAKQRHDSAREARSVFK